MPVVTSISNSTPTLVISHASSSLTRTLPVQNTRSTTDSPTTTLFIFRLTSTQTKTTTEGYAANDGVTNDSRGLNPHARFKPTEGATANDEVTNDPRGLNPHARFVATEGATANDGVTNDPRGLNKHARVRRSGIEHTRHCNYGGTADTHGNHAKKINTTKETFTYSLDDTDFNKAKAHCEKIVKDQKSTYKNTECKNAVTHSCADALSNDAHTNCAQINDYFSDFKTDNLIRTDVKKEFFARVGQNCQQSATVSIATTPSRFSAKTMLESATKNASLSTNTTNTVPESITASALDTITSPTTLSFGIGTILAAGLVGVGVYLGKKLFTKLGTAPGLAVRYQALQDDEVTLVRSTYIDLPPALPVYAPPCYEETMEITAASSFSCGDKTEPEKTRLI